MERKTEHEPEPKALKFPAKDLKEEKSDFSQRTLAENHINILCDQFVKADPANFLVHFTVKVKCEFFLLNQKKKTKKKITFHRLS